MFQKFLEQKKNFLIDYLSNLHYGLHENIGEGWNFLIFFYVKVCMDFEQTIIITVKEVEFNYEKIH